MQRTQMKEGWNRRKSQASYIVFGKDTTHTPDVPNIVSSQFLLSHFTHSFPLPYHISPQFFYTVVVSTFSRATFWKQPSCLQCVVFYLKKVICFSCQFQLPALSLMIKLHHNYADFFPPLLKRNTYSSLEIHTTELEVVWFIKTISSCTSYFMTQQIYTKEHCEEKSIIKF